MGNKHSRKKKKKYLKNKDDNEDDFEGFFLEDWTILDDNNKIKEFSENKSKISFNSEVLISQVKTISTLSKKKKKPKYPTNTISAFYPISATIFTQIYKTTTISTTKFHGEHIPTSSPFASRLILPKHSQEFVT